jgi:hypothetical protein
MIQRFQGCNRIVLFLGRRIRPRFEAFSSTRRRTRTKIFSTQLSARGSADETDKPSFVFRPHFLADSPRRVSAQWVRKNFFSLGRKRSDVPTIGRSVVIICRQTTMKITLQNFRWFRAAPPSKWPIASSRRKPTMIAIAHRPMCSAAMKATDSVDCEKIQATGANPISSSALRLTAANNTPVTVRRRASIPLRHAKMYRLGRQIKIDNIVPIAIFAGAIHNCVPPEKLPITTPYARMPSSASDRSHSGRAARQLFCNS